jgi:hypothetical protein
MAWYSLIKCNIIAISIACMYGSICMARGPCPAFATPLQTSTLRLRGGVGLADNDAFMHRMANLKDMIWKEIRDKDGNIEAGLDEEEENEMPASKRLNGIFDY